MNVTAFKRIIPQLRIAILALVALSSIGWTLYEWARNGETISQLKYAGALGAVIIGSEILFCLGAIMMLVAIGEGIPHLHPRTWASSLKQLRLETKRAASSTIKSRLFELGFWINFIGAVGTSLILMFGVVKSLPIQAWGLLVILAIDLLATIGWRIPVHLMRRKMLREQN